MYTDDIKLLTKNEKELETLIYAVRIDSQNTGMEFGMEKYAVLVKKRVKRHLTDGMEVSNQEKIKTFGEKEIYKYEGILEADTIKQAEMKEEIMKVYFRIIRKLLDKTMW